ncbi:hypothetical protein Lesp02_32190 [Lentzea sp. NBRC 105346]|uniref:hypothetical protein n=1 Tax=Lentzea sp. NBRC 105346 TaxID=3032205 RepID=UPI0024A5C90F|nr:hypothetical protein [Lentzea sp. NBRC 105346]GLZ31030.1 hypothetical protein Lesp02_32190 [Lentzea sp. NBRC 105346]
MTQRLTAVAMILGSLLLLTGTLLRSQFNFFFPDQLAAMTTHPGLTTAAYTCFLAGNVLMWPAVLALSSRIRSYWGGALVMFGLFERTFHAGIDQFALNLAYRHGASFATDLVAQSYQDIHLFSFLSFTIMFGWFVLAFEAYRAKALGVVRSIGLASMGLLPLGVLKGTELLSIVGTIGLCVAFLPEGVRLMRGAPRPSRRSLVLTAIAVPVLGALAFASTFG